MKIVLIAWFIVLAVLQMAASIDWFTVVSDPRHYTLAIANMIVAFLVWNHA